MCLLALAWRYHPRYPLVVVANRDEQHARAAAPLAFWDEAPALCAGRDLQQGGTWLGVTRGGRFAALTNYREPGALTDTYSTSRGHLVSDFLRSTESAQQFAQNLSTRMGDYAGFNLLVGDGENLIWLSNRATAGPQLLEPGLHGLSNHLLNTSWPKVCRARDGLGAVLETADDSVSLPELYRLMSATERFADDALPDTGVGLAFERLLSPVFIKSPGYGTRCTTVVIRDVDTLTVAERRFTEDAAVSGEDLHHFALSP